MGKIKLKYTRNIANKLSWNTDFVPGIFFGGDKIYCYANFSIVFEANFGGQVSERGGGKLPPVEESQNNKTKSDTKGNVLEYTMK